MDSTRSLSQTIDTRTHGDTNCTQDILTINFVHLKMRYVFTHGWYLSAILSSNFFFFWLSLHYTRFLSLHYIFFSFIFDIHHQWWNGCIRLLITCNIFIFIFSVYTTINLTHLSSEINGFYLNFFRIRFVCIPWIIE